ncbi:MAG: hypothetical protein OEV08_09450 [Nitrospira sp.]|nr:hypothetical protein [Nitrospira sp.]
MGSGRLPNFFAAVEGRDYVLAPSTTSRYWQRNRLITVTIGDDGKRVVANSPPEDQKARNVHLVGDSQVFGWNLSDHETVGFKLQDQLGPRYRVINHGLPGLGPFGYVSVLHRINPGDGIVVLLLTEMNDFQDAYSNTSSLVAHCGFIVDFEGPGQYLPCFLFHSHIFAKLVDIRDLFFSSPAPLPLNFNPYARAASAVIAARIRTLLDTARMLQPAIYVATIPWDAAVDPARLRSYAPMIATPVRYSELPGVEWIDREFRAFPAPDTLFQEADHHLSVAGANLLAKLLSEVILGQDTLPTVGDPAR